MTEDALLKFCASQDRVLCLFLDEITRGGEAAVRSRRVDDLLPLLVACCDHGCEALEGLRAALFFGKITKYEPIGGIAREFLPRWITALERFRKVVRQAQDHGPPFDRFADFERAYGEYRKTAEGFLMNWPWFDPERVAESEAAYARGEVHDAREVLLELRDQALRAGEGTDHLVGPHAQPTQRHP